MEYHNQKVHHITRIDALRGLAVLGMMVAHALFFFHDHTTDWLTTIEQLLNTTILTAFVFTAGLSLSRWLDIYAHESSRVLVVPVIKKAGILYAVYAITALVAVATVVPTLSPVQFVSQTARALTLLAPPNFTEYLPLFILLVLIILPLRTLYRWTRQSLLLTITAGALFYVTGLLLYPLLLATPVNEIKQLFAGGSGTLRFPLLFYFPIFLLGLWWQYQTDHTHQLEKLHAWRSRLVAIVAIFAIISIAAAKYYVIPLADPRVRWPPSLAFLAVGLTICATVYLILPSFRWMGAVVKTVIIYLGRDAIDLWMNHLIVLFVYRKFIGFQSGSVALVGLQTMILILIAIAASSVQLTNRIAFPFYITFQGSTRFRRRYALIILAVIIVLLLSNQQSKTDSPASGNVMISTPLTVQSNLPNDTQLVITADRQWTAPRLSQYSIINITLRGEDNSGAVVPVSPQQVTFDMGTVMRTGEAIEHPDGSLVFTLSTFGIPPGTYELKASAPKIEGTAVSNTLSLFVTEPLLVAWTFDWEGWDVPDEVFTAIDVLETPARRIPLTHFVSPRTFLPEALPTARREILASYLQKRRELGDEVALHLHMHYDLVKASGINPRSTKAWGLRGGEGYDIPATEYTSVEFGTILEFSKKLIRDAGIPESLGYRSGGWFINTQLLEVLKTQGFVYDSSGRDRPKTGAFSAIPWQLNIGAQPYYPGIDDQNNAAAVNGGLLEIPNNGVTTYESTLEELITRSQTVYISGFLNIPKTLVYTSHPQFADREFTTISPMLEYFDQMSLAQDRGPVVYVTMADIYKLWTSLE